MDDTTVSYLPTGSAAEFALTNHDVVTARSRGLDTHLAQHQQNHHHKTVEGNAHLFLRSDVRQHQVVHVGIHAASPTLPLIHLDAMLTAVGEVDLVLQHLVTAIDDTRSHLPHE